MLFFFRTGFPYGKYLSMSLERQFIFAYSHPEWILYCNSLSSVKSLSFEANRYAIICAAYFEFHFTALSTIAISNCYCDSYYIMSIISD